MGISILSKQENRIAKRITRGFSEKEIASQLFISPATVHNHSYNIRKKLNARSAVDVARKYLLSLDNPKQFLTWIIFLGIQINIIAPQADIDWRTPCRVNNSVKTVRTSRKYEA